MTTRVTITNEKDSNPLQQLVVVGHNTSGAPAYQVLKPGESAEYWVASLSHLLIVERDAAE